MDPSKLGKTSVSYGTVIPFLFSTQLLDPWQIVRVEQPDHPDALASSETGSLLAAPPEDGTPWRYESMAELDVWRAERAIEVMNVEAWRDEGHTGAGVKLAIFDPGWYGAEELADELGPVSTHDCWLSKSCEPAMDTLFARFPGEEGQHGYACAEVARDVVPDVSLYLVRVNSFTTFESAVRWSIREGIDIASMSLSFYNNSFYDGTGPFTPLVQDLLANDVLLVTSAGNDARGHWQGTFIDADGDERMDFHGRDNGLWAYLEPGARNVYVAWNQYENCGTTDLDARLVDQEGTIVGRSQRKQDPTANSCSPFERISAEIQTEGWYRLEVLHERGGTAHLKVSIHARNFNLADPDPHRAVVDPAAQAGVLAVGAVRAEDYLFNDIESFSSWGPNSAGLQKPEIAGPDGLSTRVYGGDGFFGTSASTPAVAALIAQVMSSDPSLSPYEAADRVRAWALTDGGAFDRGDPRWGSGKARLPVDSESPTVCGRRPLLMPLLFFLPWLRTRRTRSSRAPRKGSTRCA